MARPDPAQEPSLADPELRYPKGGDCLGTRGRNQARPAPGMVSMHCLSLADLVRRYRDEEVPKKRGAHVETIMLDAFLRNALANLPLAEIGPRHFATYRDARLRDVRPATICRELGIFQHMFGVAIKEWGLSLAKLVRRSTGDLDLSAMRRDVQSYSRVAAVEDRANLAHKIMVHRPIQG